MRKVKLLLMVVEYCVLPLLGTVTEAQQLAYELLHQITWQGVEFRTDIAYRAIEREQENK